MKAASLAMLGLLTLTACASAEAPPDHFVSREADTFGKRSGGASAPVPTRGRLPSIVVAKTEGEGAGADSEPPATGGDASPPWGGPPADPCESNAYTQNYCLHAAFVPSASYMPACANVPADAGCEIVHYEYAAPGDEGMWCCP